VADYGLDPSVLAQPAIGYGMPPQAAPMPAQGPSPYGLDPSVVSGVQNGFAPQPAPQQLNTPTGTGMGGDNLATAYTPEVQPQSVTGGVLAPPDASVQATPPPTVGLPVASGPDHVIGTYDALTPNQTAANNKMYAAQQAQQKAFEASPDGIAQKADAENRAVIDKERQAQADAEAAQAAQNTAVATAQADSAARQAAQEKINAAQRAHDQAATQQYAQQYAQQIKDAADLKVNTNRDIGMGGLIAVALSGIGDAIAHRNGPNAALEIINKRIDANIADQWAKKKSLGDTAAGTKDLLETSRQTATDDRQDQDVAKAAELQAVKNQIATITAQSANPQLKARGEQLQAGLDQQSAGITMGLANRKLEAQKTAADQQYKNNTLGVSYGELALRRQEHKDALTQQDKDFALKVAEYNAQGQAQQAEVTERGAMVPTGLNADGTAHYEPAMQEPGKDGVQEPWLAEKGKISEELTGFRAATIDGVKAIDVLRKKRSEFSTNEQFDNWVAHNEEGRALMQAQARALLDMHTASGINRLSGEAVELAKQELTGGLDADSVKNLMGALDTSRSTIVDQLDSRMRGAGYTGKKIEFADPIKLKVAPSPDDQQLAHVLRQPTVDQYTSETTGNSPNDITTWDPRARSDVQGFQRKMTEQLDKVGMLPSQKQTIDGWGEILSNPKASAADKKKAEANLDQATQTAQSKAIKDYALATQTQAAVNANAGASTLPIEPTSTSSSTTARDSSYGGAAQTTAAQSMIEQAPIDALTTQALRGQRDSAEQRDARQEIIRRADAGDIKAKAALVQIVGAK